MGNAHRGVQPSGACTSSVLDLVQPLGARVGRWLGAPVQRGLLPQVGAISGGSGWRMRRFIGGEGKGITHREAFLTYRLLLVNHIHIRLISN